MQLSTNPQERSNSGRTGIVMTTIAALVLVFSTAGCDQTGLCETRYCGNPPKDAGGEQMLDGLDAKAE